VEEGERRRVVVVAAGDEAVEGVGFGGDVKDGVVGIVGELPGDGVEIRSIAVAREAGAGVEVDEVDPFVVGKVRDYTHRVLSAVYQSHAGHADVAEGEDGEDPANEKPRRASAGHSSPGASDCFSHWQLV
jgi:hypothetical protein